MKERKTNNRTINRERGETKEMIRKNKRGDIKDRKERIKKKEKEIDREMLENSVFPHRPCARTNDK